MLPFLPVFHVSLHDLSRIPQHVGVIQGARNHLSTTQVDSAGFWCHRLDDYERSARLLLATVDKSQPDQVNFVRDLAGKSSRSA